MRKELILSGMLGGLVVFGFLFLTTGLDLTSMDNRMATPELTRRLKAWETSLESQFNTSMSAANLTLTGSLTLPENATIYFGTNELTAVGTTNVTYNSSLMVN